MRIIKILNVNESRGDCGHFKYRVIFTLECERYTFPHTYYKFSRYFSRQPLLHARLLPKYYLIKSY